MQGKQQIIVHLNQILSNEFTACNQYLIQTIGQQKQTIESLHPQIPRGETAQLLELITARLSEGVSPERLDTVLRLVKNERTCEPLQAKRFRIATTHNSSSSSVTIGFYNGLISVTGSGESVINEQNLPEAWFDPNQPVTIVIHQHNINEPTIIEEILPFYHSALIQNHEYRMTIAQDDEYFWLVKVSVDRCLFL